MSKLVAKIIHKSENDNIVFTYEDEADFQKYKTYTSKCELCGTIRYRAETYIVRLDDGKEIQVGTSCLNKVIDTEKLSRQESNLLSCNEIDDLFFLRKGSSRFFNARALIAFLLDYTKSIDLLTINVFEENAKDYYKEDEMNSDEVAKVLEYWENVKTDNEFKGNIQVFLKEEYIQIKYFNIVKYCVKIYKEYIHMNDICLKNSGLSNEKFTIKKIWLEKTYTDKRFSYYGVETKQYRIVDENNNIIDFTTSSEKDYLKYLNKEVSCKIKSQYKSRLGMITKVSRLALA